MAIGKRLRYEVLRRDDHTCRYCGQRAPDVVLTIDHVVPAALGGTDNADNLVTACKDCNAGKSSTNPDAPLVADVASDALRWSKAMERVAEDMLARQELRDRSRQEFRTHWDAWTFDGRTIALPPDWGTTVDRFIAAGLPMPILLDCVDIAMRASQVRFEHVHRYMCGVAWSKIDELQAQARASLADPNGTPAPRRCLHDEALGLIYGVMPHNFTDPDVRAELAEEFDDRHGQDEDGAGNPVDYRHWPQHLKAIVAAVDSLATEVFYAHRVIRHWVGRIAEGRADLDRVREAATQQAIENGRDIDPATVDQFSLALLIEMVLVLGTEGEADTT